MHLPAILFGFLVSTLIGAGFHLLKNGSLGQLLLDILLSWMGFWGGHLLCNQLGWTFLSVGPIRMGMAVFTSLLFLYLGRWLSLVNVQEEKQV